MHDYELGGVPYPAVNSGISTRLISGLHPAPDERPEPYRRPFCRDLSRCKGCPYCGHGFVCCGTDKKCLRSEIARIHHFELTEVEHGNTCKTEK